MVATSTAKEIDDATEEMERRQVYKEAVDHSKSQQVRWSWVTADVEKEHLEPDIDAPRSMSATARIRYGSVLGGGLQGVDKDEPTPKTLEPARGVSGWNIAMQPFCYVLNTVQTQTNHLIIWIKRSNPHD